MRRHAYLVPAIAVVTLAFLVAKPAAGAPRCPNSAQIDNGKACNSSSQDPDNKQDVCVIDIIKAGSTWTAQQCVHFKAHFTGYIVWKVQGPLGFTDADNVHSIPATANGFSDACAINTPNGNGNCPGDGKWHKFFRWRATDVPQQNGQSEIEYLLNICAQDDKMCVPIQVKAFDKSTKKVIPVDPTIVIQ